MGRKKKQVENPHLSQKVAVKLPEKIFDKSATDGWWCDVYYINILRVTLSNRESMTEAEIVEKLLNGRTLDEFFTLCALSKACYDFVIDKTDAYNSVRRHLKRLDAVDWAEKFVARVNNISTDTPDRKRLNELVGSFRELFKESTILEDRVWEKFEPVYKEFVATSDEVRKFLVELHHDGGIAKHLTVIANEADCMLPKLLKDESSELYDYDGDIRLD